MSERRFTVTFFKDRSASSLTTKETSLEELRDLVLATTAAVKGNLPLLKLAGFGDKRSKKGSLRYNANVKSICGVEIDYDSGVMTFDEAVARIREARLAALLYTSPSNAPGKPRWRVILPTSRDLPPEDRFRLVARVNGVLGGIIAGESFTLSLSYYYGSVNNNPHHRAEVIEGDFVDERGDLDAGALGKKSKSNPGAADILFPNWRSAATSEKQADEDLVYAALAVIPNDVVGWVYWCEMAMASWLSTNGSLRGFEAFDMWSAKNPEHNKEDTTQSKWAHLNVSPPTEIGAGTIFMKADQAQPGWRALKGLPIDRVNEIIRLSKLAAPQYDAERKDVAQRFSMRRSTLDDIVAKLRPQGAAGDDNDIQGTRITFPVVEPWPDAVRGEKLIRDMVKTINSHVILVDHQALTVALWIIHTHVFEAGEHTPRLQIRSPTMRCGKTTLLNTVAPMVAKPLEAADATMAALFRIIAMIHPTMVIDEADSFLKSEDGRDDQEPNKIFRNGHKRGGHVLRVVGDKFEPRQFDVFCPIIFAWLVKRGITVIPAVEDRSITIELRRRRPDEKITRLRSNKTGHLRDLGSRAARWAADNFEALKNADPDLPKKLNDREMDNWRILIAIADQMSEAIGKEAREAALKIAEERVGGEEDYSTLALEDVAAIFKKQKEDKLASNYIVMELINMEDRPWGEYGRQRKPLTKDALARLLKPFRIKPKELRFGGDTRRGYERGPIMEAKSRFVDERPKPTEEGREVQSSQDADEGQPTEEGQEVQSSQDADEGQPTEEGQDGDGEGEGDEQVTLEPL
jgi:putative DNA primase/helicase